jgi:hypothetical protein
MHQSTPRTDARSVEARLFRTFWDDGQIDLFFGVGALGIGAFWSLDLIPLGAVVPAVLAVFWTPLRRAIVEPRAGRVEFSDARSARGRRMLLGAWGIGLGVLVLLLLAAITRGAGTADVLDGLIAALPALLIAAMAGLVAAGLRIGRFLAYATVFALAGLGAAISGREPEVAILVGGLTVTASGTWLLSRFLRRTSRLETDR